MLHKGEKSMNRKKVSGIIAIIMICSILGISSKKIYADNTKNSQISVITPVKESKISVPTAEQIKEKKHFQKLKDICKETQPESLQTMDPIKSADLINTKINTYLNAMDTNTLLLTIAETADELSQYNDSSGLTIFSAAVQNKLVPNLSSRDYIQLVNSNDVNTYFKVFMIDTAIYSKKNDEKFNRKLRELVKENMNNDELLQSKGSSKITDDSSALNSKEELFNYSLQSISDYNAKDVPMLKNVLDFDRFNDMAKTTALYKLSDIDKKTTDKYLDDIVKNKDKYTAGEEQASLFILSKYFRIYDDKEKYKRLLIKNADDIFKNNQLSNSSEDSKKLVDAAVFALGETKNKDSIRLVGNNMNSINDNAIVSYFVDMNFVIINEMLEDNNSKNDIKLALSLADTSRYIEFSDNLEKLKNNPDKEISEKAASILDKLDKNSDQYAGYLWE